MPRSGGRPYDIAARSRLDRPRGDRRQQLHDPRDRRQAGLPWPSPVWYAHSGYREFFWASSPLTRHSRNLAERPQTGIVIFDSHVPAGTAQAVYMKATAAEVTPDELPRALGRSQHARRRSAAGYGPARRSAHRPPFACIAPACPNYSSSTTTTSECEPRSGSDRPPEASYAICAACDSFPAAGRLKSTMVWCQVYGAPPRRRSVWAVAGERQPAAAWTRPGTGCDAVADGRTGRLQRSHGSVKQQVENKNEFWAEVSAIAVCPVAIAAGVAKGAYDASTDNGAFVDGFSAAAAPIIRAARGFGEQHGTTITKGVVTGAAGTLGARIMREGLKHVVG